MKTTPWTIDVTARWKRALDLKNLRASGGGLRIQIEEESGRSWSLDFKPVQAWRVTSEECAGNLIAMLPAEGALFLVQDSDWRKELGDSGSVQKSQHFIICCYDEVVEVLAWGCTVTPATQ